MKVLMVLKLFEMIESFCLPLDFFEPLESFEFYLLPFLLPF